MPSGSAIGRQIQELHSITNFIHIVEGNTWRNVWARSPPDYPKMSLHAADDDFYKKKIKIEKTNVGVLRQPPNRALSLGNVIQVDTPEIRYHLIRRSFTVPGLGRCIVILPRFTSVDIKCTMLFFSCFCFFIRFLQITDASCRLYDKLVALVQTSLLGNPSSCLVLLTESLLSLWKASERNPRKQVFTFLVLERSIIYLVFRICHQHFVTPSRHSLSCQGYLC